MSWRCEHGFHAYRFVSMGNIRYIEIPGHSSSICRLTEKCKRCGYLRVTPRADVPRRIKTYKWPTTTPPRIENVAAPRYGPNGRRLPEPTLRRRR